MTRDVEARALVRQSAFLVARAEVLLGKLIEHTEQLEQVVIDMQEDSAAPAPKDHRDH